MIGVDTNVLLRFLVDDDVEQNQAARAFLSRRTGNDPIFISAVTIAETVWVLTKTLGYKNPDVGQLLRLLLASDGVVIEHGRQLGVLLEAKDIRRDSLADHLIAWSGKAFGCSHTVTFDKRAVREIPSMELLA